LEVFGGDPLQSEAIASGTASGFGIAKAVILNSGDRLSISTGLQS
jgi:hypothetical protein